MTPGLAEPSSPTIGIEEAAQILRCGMATVHQLVDAGDLPALKLNQRHIVLLREDVIDYVRRQAREQARERKLLCSRQQAAASMAPSPSRSRGAGRARRPLPDLTSYEIVAGKPPI